MKKRIIGTVVMAVLAVTLTVILTFYLLQPISNSAISSTTPNFGAYAGAGSLVNTIPIFNGLLPIIVSIGGMFAILAGVGVARM